MRIAWGVSTLWGRVPGLQAQGIRGGSDDMLSVRRQRAVLATPQPRLRNFDDRVVASFCSRNSFATSRGAWNVISREAFRGD